MGVHDATLYTRWCQFCGVRFYLIYTGGAPSYYVTCRDCEIAQSVMENDDAPSTQREPAPSTDADAT